MADTDIAELTELTEALGSPYVICLRAAAYPRGDADDALPMQKSKAKRTPPGFVMLFTSDFMPIEPANEFLMTHCGPAKGPRWQNTQKGYADDLAQYWTFLVVNRIAWTGVTASDLDDYAYALASAVSPTTSRKYAKQTITRRVGTAERFQDWASKRGYASPLAKPEGATTVDVIRDPLLLPHLGEVSRESQGRRPRKRSKSAHVSFISNNDLIRILSHLGPSPHEKKQNDLRPIRDRVITEFSLYSGMRVEEITSLDLYQALNIIAGLEKSDPFKPISLTIRETKGGGSRPVIIPTFIMQAIETYIDSERTPVVEYVREKLKRSSSSALFLNGDCANHRDMGRKMSANSASRAFRLAVQAAGLMRLETRFCLDAATGEPRYNDIGELAREHVEVAKYSFHDLRHTFACQYYASQIKAGHPNPWKKLQARLGHASMATTLDIYLAHFESSEPEISDRFSRVLAEQLYALG